MKHTVKERLVTSEATSVLTNKDTKSDHVVCSQPVLLQVSAPSTDGQLHGSKHDTSQETRVNTNFTKYK